MPAKTNLTKSNKQDPVTTQILLNLHILTINFTATAENFVTGRLQIYVMRVLAKFKQNTFHLYSKHRKKLCFNAIKR